MPSLDNTSVPLQYRNKPSKHVLAEADLIVKSPVMPVVTIPTVTLTRKVGPGLQDLQTRARRILAERNAQKAEENTWIGRMVAAESIGELDGLIRSRAA